MKKQRAPLAERVRPKTIEQYIGQTHLLGEGSPLRRFIESGQIPSMIFWGPPGVGKTTLAHLIANAAGLPFYQLSAISSGVKDLRDVIGKATEEGKALLFIDEIHRFNKAQQDALLGAVEKGIITLIGATTENPSFEVINALLSRAQTYVLKELTKDELLTILHQAVSQDEDLQQRNINFKETGALLRLSGGDARKLLNLLDMIVEATPNKNVIVTDALVEQIAQRKAVLYDKTGEQHYDIISAFIKSMRGSDPNAAVYYLARMVEGGEDPKFIARRMVIFASEDIGNANPTALVLATSCFTAVNLVGYPEARIILSQTAVYLAASVKSNASYMAIENALDAVRKTGDAPVPLAIRNAPTRLMKELGYHRGYQYAHDYDLNFVEMEYMPDEVKGTAFFDPGNNPREHEMREFLRRRWKEKYGY